MSNKNWPAEKVEKRKVSSLTPYVRNARTHSAEQVDQIAASIREWGWTTPVLIDEKSTIIAGHGRVLAAQKLGVEEIPVMVAKGWTETQKQAYVIADNKLALNAGWDMDLLKLEMQDIDAAGLNLELTGFGLDEISEIISNNTGEINFNNNQNDVSPLEEKNYQGAVEYNQDQFDNFQHQCPRCGFEFNK